MSDKHTNTTKSPSGSPKQTNDPDEIRLQKLRRKRAMEQKKSEKHQQQLILLVLGALLFFGILYFASVLSSCVGATGSFTGTNSSMVSSQSTEGNTQLTVAEVTSAPTPSPTPLPVSLTVTVVGDCTLGTDEYFDYSSSLNNYCETYGTAYFMQNVMSIFSSDDLTIANLEGVFTDSTERADKTYAFKAPASFASILTDGSIEAVNTANNHSHDYGDASYNDTLAALDAVNVAHFGYEETAVREIKGVKIGMVGIYELNDHLGCAEQLKNNIAKVKQEGAQLIIVIFHWGNELEVIPDEYQTTLGRLAIDEGADLVCGHHPHVLQGIETYKGKNIVYSLGNFCFGGNSYPSDMDTMIFQQTFTISGNTVVLDNDSSVIPCSVSSELYYNNYQPTPSEDSEASRILQKVQERSSWITTAASDSYNYFQRPDGSQ